MNKRTLLTTIAFGVAVSLPAFSAPLARAGDTLPRYLLFDIGSFGGKFSTFCYPNCRQLNNRGEAVGIDATSFPDPFNPCFYDCNVDYAFKWRYGGTNDLGSLQYLAGSWAQGINDSRISAGLSLNGKYDKKTQFWQARGVVWKNGKVINIGTLGGTQSNAWMINNAGQVVADALTDDSRDPYINVSQANCRWLPTNGGGCASSDFGINTLYFPVATAIHGAIWTQAGKLGDIGTLGGPDSSAFDINDAGQIVGWSYTSYSAGPSGVPDTHPFVWQNGTMIDLGSPLGGTFAAATLINKNGQIAGVANTTGDAAVHSVVWESDHTPRDCGTLGSDYGHPDWMNDQGDIVGFSRTVGGLGRGFVCWHTNHEIVDLGTIGDDPESEATGINNAGMIVGITFQRGVADLKGWVSNQGGPITDLDTLIRSRHGIHVVAANTINDSGVIAAQGELKNGEHHAIILVPDTNFALIAKITATMAGLKNESVSASSVTQPGASHGARPGCASPVRLRPHFCNPG